MQRDVNALCEKATGFVTEHGPVNLDLMTACTQGVSSQDNGTNRFITKNNEDQVVVLTTDVMPRTIRGLRSWLRELGDVRPSEPLFRGKHGGRLAYRSLHEQWNHLCARLNLLDQGRPQYTIHQLRHTFGTEKIAQHPEQLVARMMGHRDVRSTRQYAQVNDEQVRVALSRKQR